LREEEPGARITIHKLETIKHENVQKVAPLSAFGRVKWYILLRMHRSGNGPEIALKSDSGTLAESRKC
jgi:hypothetical protein